MWRSRTVMVGHHSFVPLGKVKPLVYANSSNAVTPIKHISHRDQYGPLIVSVLSTNAETVAHLINEAGCDVKEVDGEGDSILDCVAAFGANQVLDYLFER